MNKFYIILIIVLILLFHDNFRKIRNENVVYIGNYKTKNFQKDSKSFFKDVEDKKIYSEETLEELARTEDQFLALESETVCGGLSRYREAMVLDQQMKDRFMGLDFKHHHIHLKQMSEPNKLINKDLHCA